MTSPDSSNRVRAHRAMLNGRCIDCHGSGERPRTYSGKPEQCRTCSGSGKLTEWTVTQVAYSAALTVAAAVDALLELQSDGLLDCCISRVGAPDIWRVKTPSVEGAERKAI